MNNTWNNILLVFNVLLWSITFLIYQWKRKQFGVGSCILFLYTSISVMSIFLYYNPYARGLFKDLSLIPYIYLYLMMMLSFKPLFMVENSKIIKIKKPTNSLFNIICYIIISLSIVGFVGLFPELKENLFMLFIDSDYGRYMYQYTTDKFMSKTSSGMDVLSIISNIFIGISPLFLIYYMTFKKKNKFILYGLFFSTLIGPLYAVSTGGRTAVVLCILKIVFLFLFLRKFIDFELRRKISITLIIILLVLFIPFALLSMSRSAGDIDRLIYTIERYGSESFINFNNYGLDANGCRYGDRTVVLFKEILGLDSAKYFANRLSKYSYMNMNKSVFYTYVGEFTLDYGPIFSVVIFIISSLFFFYSLNIKNNCMMFYQYIIYYILLYGCLGYFHFPWSNIDGNLQLVTLLFLSLIFKVDSLKIKKYKS